VAGVSQLWNVLRGLQIFHGSATRQDTSRACTFVHGEMLAGGNARPERLLPGEAEILHQAGWVFDVTLQCWKISA
jgi:hypothetical protein